MATNPTLRPRSVRAWSLAVALVVVFGVGACTKGPVQNGIPQGPTPGVRLGPDVILSEACKSARLVAACSGVASLGFKRVEINCDTAVGDRVSVGMRGPRPEYRADLVCRGVDSDFRRELRLLLLAYDWRQVSSSDEVDVYAALANGPEAGHDLTARFTGTRDVVRASVSLLAPPPPA